MTDRLCELLNAWASIFSNRKCAGYNAEKASVVSSADFCGVPYSTLLLHFVASGAAL